MNEHKNIITVEDEIKEFSDKPVKSSALFKALEEKGVPDSSEASVGDVLTKGENGIGWETPSGGGMPQDYPLSYSKIYDGVGTPEDGTITTDLESLPEASAFEIVVNSGAPIVCMQTSWGGYADTDHTTEIWEENGSVCVWSETFTDGSSVTLTVTAVNVNEQFKAGVTMVDSTLPSNPLVRIYGDLYQMYAGTITIYDGSGAPTQYLSYAALAPIVEEENEGNGGE